MQETMRLRGSAEPLSPKILMGVRAIGAYIRGMLYLFEKREAI